MIIELHGEPRNKMFRLRHAHAHAHAHSFLRGTEYECDPQGGSPGIIICLCPQRRAVSIWCTRPGRRGVRNSRVNGSTNGPRRAAVPRTIILAGSWAITAREPRSKSLRLGLLQSCPKGLLASICPGLNARAVNRNEIPVCSDFVLVQSVGSLKRT